MEGNVMRIWLTGSTGALGGEVLRTLKSTGTSEDQHRVMCLVRGANQDNVEQRLKHQVGECRDVHAVKGDITQPNCGVDITSPELQSEMDPDVMIHCAASVAFLDNLEAEKANVEGVKNVLALATQLGVKRFVHVSTAYTIGELDELHESDRPTVSHNQPRNAYEITKIMGESLVREWANEDPTRTVKILRPSIVVGREDGSTPTGDAYYTYVKGLYNVRKLALGMLRKNQIRGCEITEHENGAVRIRPGPVVLMGLQSTLNMVPIDWCADMVVRSAQSEASGGVEVFHLTHPNPPRTRDVLKWTLDAIGLEGINMANNKEMFQSLRSRFKGTAFALHRALEKTLGHFEPYTNTNPDFKTDRTREVMGADYRPPPTLDEQFFSRTIAFAVENLWE